MNEKTMFDYSYLETKEKELRELRAASFLRLIRE